MAGKSACALAAGKMESVVEDLFRVSFTDLLSSVPAGVKDDDLNGLLSGFETAKSEVATTLRLKLDFWRRLPWMLAALAHHDPDEVRKGAGRCVAAILAEPRAEVHHRLTRLSILLYYCSQRDKPLVFVL